MDAEPLNSSSPLMYSTDVQAILRLVGGAAELWYQPTLQREFTLDSLCNLLSAKTAVCYVLGDVLTGGENACGPAAYVGLDDAARERFDAFLRTGTPRDPVIDVLAALDGRVITLSRPDAVSDDDWYGSEHFAQVRQPLGLDHALYVKIVAASLGRQTIVMLSRPAGESAFTDRDAYLCELCLSEMAWPYTPDVDYTDPRIEALQPRLKKVMRHLLEGDSEKQVALKLGLSPHSVHQYVKQLYAQLEVSSRGELLAQWVGKF
ncbi:MAG: LuxR C-terminal-related transcriptional regulator [Tepidisphaeraceae bacterium]